MKKLLIALTCLSMTSCGVLWEFRGLEEMPFMNWEKSNVLSFNADISATGTYDVIILFRHVQGFPHAAVAINMEISGPDTDLKEAFVIPVIDENREYLGEGSVDIWDIEHLALPAQKLQAGEYDFKLGHGMQKEDLQLVMEVGIMITKSEK